MRNQNTMRKSAKKAGDAKGKRLIDAAETTKPDPLLARLRTLNAKQSIKLKKALVKKVKRKVASHVRQCNQTESPLLRLPSELLLHIAEYVWPMDNQAPIPLKPRIKLIVVDEKWQPSYYSAGPEYQHAVALLHTSSRLRRELSSTFLANTVFEMELFYEFDYDLKYMADSAEIAYIVNQWLVTFPSHSWNALRQVRINLKEMNSDCFWPPVARGVAKRVERRLFGEVQEPPRVYIAAKSLNWTIAEFCWVSHKREAGMMNERGRFLSDEENYELFDCR